MAAHPAEDLDRGAHRTDGAERSRSRAGRRGSPCRERARGGARQQQRADEMAAAAVVLLRCRLARLVGADRDVLGSVIRGELAAAEGDHGRRERGEGGDGFLREEPELRAASDARRCRSGDDRNRDPRPLEREASLGQRAAHVGEHRERLGEPQRAADERRRHVRRKPPLDAGGRSDRAVGAREPRRPTRSGRARGRRSREPCRRAAASPCGEGTVLRWTPVRCSTSSRPREQRATGLDPRRHRRARRGGEDDARARWFPGAQIVSTDEFWDGEGVRPRSPRAGGRRAARPRRRGDVRLVRLGRRRARVGRERSSPPAS